MPSHGNASALLASRIVEHIELFEQALARVGPCARERGQCPGWWQEVERGWRRNATTALAMRLERHAREQGDFLPQSEPSTLRALLLTVRRERRTWPVLQYWQPDFSCEGAEHRTKSQQVKDDMRGGQMQGVNDGGKWLCGSRPEDFSRPSHPCRILSIGSNFEDDFERAMHGLAGCRSLVFDPTLGPEGGERVRAFAGSLAQYGSRLNASVGLGLGSIWDRERDARHALRPLAEILAGSGDFFDQRPMEHGVHPHHSARSMHLTVAKIDAEGGEFRDGLLGPKGLWALCASGMLTVDQVNVEVHLRAAPSLGDVNAIFEGAARCGMMLLHTETNWRGCKRGGCTEFSWASLYHVRRVLRRARRRDAALKSNGTHVASASPGRRVAAARWWSAAGSTAAGSALVVPA